VLVFLIILEIHAGENYFTGGVNISRFYDVGSKPLSGFALGYGHEWQKGDASALSLGISWFCRGSLLEDKIIPPPPGTTIFIFDIYSRMEYLELPFYYRRYITNINQNRLYWTTGIVASLGIYDASSKELVRKWWDSEFPRENGNYFWNEDPDWTTPPKSSTIDFMIGAGIKGTQYGLEGQLRIDVLGDVDTSATIGSIDTKFLTFLINAFWYF
jgi:hypothetical protein